MFAMKPRKFIHAPQAKRSDVLAAGRLAFMRAEYAKSVAILESYLKQFPAPRSGAGPWADASLIVGLSYFKMGNFALAHAACRRAGELNPANPVYRINAARCLEKLGDEQAGLQELESIAADKRTAEWWSTHASLLSASGELDGALSAYRAALALNPADSEASMGVIGTLFRQQDMAAMEAQFDALRIDKVVLESRCSIQIFRLIHHWMRGDVQAVDALLSASSEDLKQLDKASASASLFVIPFATFIARLIRFRLAVPALFLDSAADNKILYAAGDSHCLSLANTYFETSGGRYRVQAALNPGCKAFHLGQPKANLYKAGLERIVDRLPPKANLILMTGEIDCRRDEGILAHAEKAGKDPAAIAQDVVEKYLDHVTRLRDARAINLSICGVPAPCPPAENEKHGHRFGAQKNMIAAFNQALRDGCARRRLGFLDAYAITAADEGAANGKFHLDNIHLAPHFLLAAAAHQGGQAMR